MSVILITTDKNKNKNTIERRNVFHQHQRRCLIRGGCVKQQVPLFLLLLVMMMTMIVTIMTSSHSSSDALNIKRQYNSNNHNMKSLNRYGSSRDVIDGYYYRSRRRRGGLVKNLDLATIRNATPRSAGGVGVQPTLLSSIVITAAPPRTKTRTTTHRKQHNNSNSSKNDKNTISRRGSLIRKRMDDKSTVKNPITTTKMPEVGGTTIMTKEYPSKTITTATATCTDTATSTSTSTTSTATSTTTTKQPAASSSSLPLYQLALAGSIATFVSDIALHPIDTIKTLQQTDIGLDMSFIDAAKHLYYQSSSDGGSIGQLDGLLGGSGFLGGGSVIGFYNGFSTYAITDAMAGAIKFTVWELWKSNMMNSKMEASTSSDDNVVPSNNDALMNMLKSLIGAGLAFVASSIILIPGELLKQQLQMSSSLHVHYDSVWDALFTILHDSGISGLYTGYEGVLFRDVPYTMIELSLYEVLKKATTTRTALSTITAEAVTEGSVTQQQQQQQQQKNQRQQQQQQQQFEVTDTRQRDRHKENPLLSSSRSSAQEEEGNDSIADGGTIPAATLTGAIGGWITTPFDTIKTKLMVMEDYAAVVDNGSGVVGSSTTTITGGGSFIDCMLSTIENHGWISLFSGGLARVCWLAPLVAIYLPLYDTIKQHMLIRHQNHYCHNQNLEQQQQQQEHEQL